MHDLARSKYIILLKNLFGRDANLVLLTAFQNLRKILEPSNLFCFKILKFVHIHWKYPALANLKYFRVKISDLNSYFHVRAALFEYNFIHVRSISFTLGCQKNVPLLIIFGKFEDHLPPLLPAYQFLQFSKLYIKKN